MRIKYEKQPKLKQQSLKMSAVYFHQEGQIRKIVMTDKDKNIKCQCKNLKQSNRCHGLDTGCRTDSAEAQAFLYTISWLYYTIAYMCVASLRISLQIIP